MISDEQTFPCGLNSLNFCSAETLVNLNSWVQTDSRSLPGFSRPILYPNDSRLCPASQQSLKERCWTCLCHTCSQDRLCAVPDLQAGVSAAWVLISAKKTPAVRVSCCLGNKQKSKQRDGKLWKISAKNRSSDTRVFVYIANKKKGKRKKREKIKNELFRGGLESIRYNSEVFKHDFKVCSSWTHHILPTPISSKQHFNKEQVTSWWCFSRQKKNLLA